MNKTGSLSRRKFMEKAATIGVIGFAAPPLVLGAKSRATAAVSPNSRIHVGIIGCGGQGRGNLGNCAKHPDVVVTAARDVWKERRELVASQFKDTCRLYSDYREM